MQNCVGCDGKGLADGVAKKLPYGCSYTGRRRMPPKNKFAVPEDRAVPGTIDVRRAPAGGEVFDAKPRPTVINIFAQFEMGGPGKYNRVKPAPAGGDGAAAREGWFKECLGRIGRMPDGERPASIAVCHRRSLCPVPLCCAPPCLAALCMCSDRRGRSFHIRSAVGLPAETGPTTRR